MPKLPPEYYQHSEVTEIAQDLLGKILYSSADGIVTAGKIVETEAYNGRTDKACHAHLGRRTKRTEIMYRAGGVAYVYLTYGIHNLFNIVTNQEGLADAVLVRAVEPLEGIEVMAERRGLPINNKKLTSGPGMLTQAMGISKQHYGATLQGPELWIEDAESINQSNIVSGPRIGIAYAQEDALLPWRFSILNNPWVSAAKANYKL